MGSGGCWGVERELGDGLERGREGRRGLRGGLKGV